ncbi:uncharacterized protein LOC108115195 [Drosophila eugracilis]|uniref:uncharacterized protein LOC108115195 n=1 Tax=Drosophila eugracilis TaxID=29029 RepID=UPI0007E82E5C|nr:uncharacterized protein LOC108115195 [Drosophila eugracilis]
MMQILVQTRDGRKSIYEVDRFGTVGSLKARIGRDMSVPMGFSRLTYKGRVLANHSVLEDVGVKRMSTLDLCWQPVVLTPKRLSEMEEDLDHLEQKQNQMQSSIIERYDQMVKTGGMVQASSSSQDDDTPIADISNPINEDDDDDLDDLLCPSSDGWEFFNQEFPKKSDDEIEKMPEALKPIALPTTPLVLSIQPKKPEASAPAKPTNQKKKGKKNRKKK